MKTLVIAGAICLLAGCAATPGVAAGNEPPAPVASAAAATEGQAPAAGDEQVCKRMTVAGSIRPKRVCATRAEWDAQAEQDLQNRDDFDRDRRAADGVRSFE